MKIKLKKKKKGGQPVSLQLLSKTTYESEPEVKTNPNEGPPYWNVAVIPRKLTARSVVPSFVPGLY